VSYKKQELLTLHEQPRSPPVFGGGRVGQFLVFFVLSYYEYLRFEFRVVRNDIFIINDMRLSLPQVVCRRTRVLFTLFEDSCFYVICVCLHIVLCFSSFYVHYVVQTTNFMFPGAISWGKRCFSIWMYFTRLSCVVQTILPLIDL
jgi:hypothetical protein